MPDRIIYTSVLSTAMEIRLYEETVEHVKNHHPEVPIELPSIESAVAQTIVNPTHVEVSYGNSYVFVDIDSTNASGDPLRVPVKMITSDSGRVKTAYFASTNGTPELAYVRNSRDRNE
ncbi:hypothetical protein ACQKKX_02480 [Neorhizobium sp. NPDC001467]|uniref:hypothetical protein n=1 Tax=Neorhizobium sp. NPDC001467 TaxID=3390595 RepID=UPI003D03A9AC